MVAKNVLLRRCKVLTTGRLESLDLLLGHVDEQGKVGRVAPKAD
jgi:hypothetical protein